MFFKFIYLFYLEINYFIILQWFLPYVDMNQPLVYMCAPHPETPSHHPPQHSYYGSPKCPETLKYLVLKPSFRVDIGI